MPKPADSVLKAKWHATGGAIIGQAPKPHPLIDEKTLQARISKSVLAKDFCPARSAQRGWRQAAEKDRSDGKIRRKPSGGCLCIIALLILEPRF
jgi:hypothetical protein